ncbi:MAG: hypothetical protein GY798_30280 [Hyphomicrobiales bacterium]|nr:hypothetical protein [Hyphomicrobiales bacterium]
MSLDRKKDSSRRAIQMWASDNTDKPGDLFAPNYINHQESDVEGGVSSRSLEDWRELVGGYHRGFSDSAVTVSMQIAEGDRVATRWEITATQTGDYMGLAPTNETVTWTGVSIDRFDNGKIVESWVDWDKYRLFRGIGLVGHLDGRDSAPGGRPFRSGGPTAPVGAGKTTAMQDRRPREAMRQVPFGRTGVKVSALGFGCGTVGGLIIRGSAAERERAVARALERGITYFDTAASYGDGLSETHLGQVWKALRPKALIGTKFRFGGNEAAIAASLDSSLQRLQMDSVDLFQLHNPIVDAGSAGGLDADTVVDRVAPALRKLQESGKVRFIGFTGVGDPSAIADVVDRAGFDTAQLVVNLINPTGVAPAAAGFEGRDYDRLVNRAAGRGLGTIGIRIMAGGALSGRLERHAIASPNLKPIGSGPTYAEDVARTKQLAPIVDRGFASSLIEASVRFVAFTETLHTALLGCSSLDQLDTALDAFDKGPLPEEALRLVTG